MKNFPTAHKVKSHLQARKHARAHKKSVHQQHAENLYKLAHPESAKRQKNIRRTLTHVALPIALIVASASFAVGAEVLPQKDAAKSAPKVPANSVCRYYDVGGLSAQDSRIGVTVDNPEYTFKFVYNFKGYTPNYLYAEDASMNQYNMQDMHNNILQSQTSGFTYMKVCIVNPGPVMPPFTSRSALVDQQYRDFYGRSATAAEQSYWAGSGMNAEQIVDSFVSGDATQRGPLVRLYKAYYKRWPDAGGYDYWVRKMKGGASLTSVSNFFAQSNEFKTKYGSLTNEQFMNLIYNNVMERTPDPSGYNYWVKKLNDKKITRGGVMLQFSESSEFKRKYGLDCELVGVTLRMLRRPATAGELQSWNPDQNASTLAAPIILNSNEYASRIVK